MKRITLFSFGYWGWGNATHQLIEAVDAIESARGFAPPIFVDTRIRRAVRARGFNGNAFETAAGSDRYRHTPSLGNLWVLTHSGPRIQINEPAAANELLDMAVSATSADRRLIFFCACEFPFLEGAPEACHRVTVARLVMEAALKRGLPLEIVEWPGGAPGVLDIPVTPKNAEKLLLGAKSIPLDPNPQHSNLAGPAWGSTVMVKKGCEELHAVVGPARYGRGQWYLPIVWEPPDKSGSFAELQSAVGKWRHDFGFEPRTVL